MPDGWAKDLLRRAIGQTGEHWCRTVMNQSVDSWIEHKGPEQLTCVEVSGQRMAAAGWSDYRCLEYPSFDLCDGAPAPVMADIVVCEQVIEHVIDPGRALAKLFELCHPGGWLVVSTPFLLRVHRYPADYWRFTPDGLRVLLDRAGFVDIDVHGWGNRACVRRNLVRFVPRRRWSRLHNDPDVPVVVWAFARRPVGPADVSTSGGRSSLTA